MIFRPLAGPRPWRTQVAELWQTLQHWPWLETLRTLRERFREDRLGQAAGSLTFTTLMSLVPLVTVMLAVFSAFPYFAGFRGALEQFFLENLVPDGIARTVMTSLTRFAGKATQLGALGLIVLTSTALALMLTIDRALNRIWRVSRVRPFAKRVMVYWAALTLGPLLLGASLTMTSYALGASKGWLGAMPGGVGLLIDVLQFAMMVMAASALFRYVPNTHVQPTHALAGGVFVAVAFELAKAVLGWYLKGFSTLGSVYGAFAAVPILLLWTYLVWVVVLLGAVVAAYAPTLRLQGARRSTQAGWRLDLALRILAQLHVSRRGHPHGMTVVQLAETLRIDPLQIEPLLQALVDLQWVGRLDEEGAQRHVLLADPQHTPAEPLLDRLLLAPSPATRSLRERTGWSRLRLTDLLD